MLQPIGEQEGRELARFPHITSDPFAPFLIVGGLFEKDREPQPPFLETIKRIAESQELSYTLWDIDPDAMPATKAVRTDLAPRLSQVAPALVLSQESWSKEPHDYEVGFTRPLDRRSSHYNVRIPFADITDGVFFYTYNARLYIWPKARMDDAVIQLLQMSGLIDSNRFAQFIDQGFARMKTTDANER